MTAKPEEIDEIIQAAAEVFDTPRQAVIGTDLAGIIIYWNSGAEKLYGWSAEEACGRSVLDVTPSAVSRKQGAEIMERLKKGLSWTGEFPVTDRNGREFMARVQDVPVHSATGRLVGMVGISERVKS